MEENIQSVGDQTKLLQVKEFFPEVVPEDVDLTEHYAALCYALGFDDKGICGATGIEQHTLDALLASNNFKNLIIQALDGLTQKDPEFDASRLLTKARIESIVNLIHVQRSAANNMERMGAAKLVLDEYERDKRRTGGAKGSGKDASAELLEIKMQLKALEDEKP